LYILTLTKRGLIFVFGPWALFGKVWSIKNFKKKISDKFFQIMLGRIGFWSGRLYDLILTENSAELVESARISRKKWIVVLGRDAYLEVDKEYPVGRASDLKKIVAAEPWRFPYKGPRFNKITRLSDSSHRVTSWILKPGLIEALDYRPLWVLPESVCFDDLERAEVLEVNRLGQTVYLANTADGFLSSLGHKKVFLRKIGIGSKLSPIATIVQVSEESAVAMMVVGIMRSLKTAPLRFFLGFDLVTLTMFPWKRAAQVAAATGVAYLTLTSGYLFLANNWVDSRLEAGRDSADHIIGVRNDIASSLARASKISSILSNVDPMWVAWEVFLDLKDMDVRFRAINSNGPEVTFYVSAAKATDVLSMLGNHPRVSSVELANPVRQVGYEQQFSVRAIFNSDEAVTGQSELKSSLVIGPKPSDSKYFTTDAGGIGYD